MFDNACRYNEPESTIYKVGGTVRCFVRAMDSIHLCTFCCPAFVDCGQGNASVIV